MDRLTLLDCSVASLLDWENLMCCEHQPTVSPPRSHPSSAPPPPKTNFIRHMQSGISLIYCCLDCVVASCLYVFPLPLFYLWFLGGLSILFCYSFSLHLCLCNSFVYRRRRTGREKKVIRARFETTATAPSHPARQDVSRSDHSAGSKESASWWSLRQRFGLTRSVGVGKGRKKEKKEEGGGSHDEPALEKKEGSCERQFHWQQLS